MVERTWQEMDRAGDLETYLKAALKREEIILDRDKDLDRFRKSEPPVSYQEWRNLEAARDAFFDENPSATREDWDALVEGDEAENEGGEV